MTVDEKSECRLHLRLFHRFYNQSDEDAPTAISAEQALGFSLCLIRTVLSGRGDEVIDLAHANLLR